MSSNTPEGRKTEISLIVILVSILMLLPPVLNLWAEADNPWYIPYLVWLGIIVLTFFLQRVLRKHVI